MQKLLIALAAGSLGLAGCGQPAGNNSTTAAGGSADMATTAPGSTVDRAVTDGVATDGVSTNGIDPMTGTASASGTGTIVAPGANVTEPRNAQDYVDMAASADQYEIQASQLVLIQSKNPAVRAFAQQMIDDHRAAAQKLQAAARSAEAPAPGTRLLPRHQTRLAELRAAGASLDQVYISQQRGAHAETIALHQGVAAASALADPLIAHARDTLINVNGHAAMLRGLNPAS